MERGGSHADSYISRVASLRWHVTSSVNRPSIEEHGLDWRYMRLAGGVAGHATGVRTPEQEGIFLCDDWFDVEWFAQMARSAGIESVDVWEFSLEPTESAVEDQTGYRFLPHPIPRERLRLVRQDWSPPSMEEDADDSEPEYLDWISVMENEPDLSPGPPEWPHWYVHGSDGFEELEPAIEWATKHSDSVIIGPLTRDYYFVGRRPEKWDEKSTPLREWPPSDEERHAIDENYLAVRRRLEAINEFAPRLATAIAARLSSVLPKRWTATSDGTEVVILYEGQRSHGVDFKETSPEDGLLELLDFAQDWISELTTVPWPHAPTRPTRMFAPTVELRESTLRARYGPAEDPLLELDPLDLDSLLP
jgi:hypothetical protein